MFLVQPIVLPNLSDFPPDTDVLLRYPDGRLVEGFRLDNDVLAICPNAAATPLLSLDKYNRFTKNC